MSGLIETKEGILIEVEVDGFVKCAAGSADRVEKGLDQVGSVLRKACDAMAEFWKQRTEGVVMDEVQIEFGLNFETEGNVYIARGKAGATFSVTATLKKQV